MFAARRASLYSTKNHRGDSVWCSKQKSRTKNAIDITESNTQERRALVYIPLFIELMTNDSLEYKYKYAEGPISYPIFFLRDCVPLVIFVNQEIDRMRLYLCFCEKYFRQCFSIL